MLKCCENPPILSPSTGSLAEFAGDWWVAYTRARNEKALAWDLLSHNIAYFLPLVERLRFSGGRRRRVLLALFPSYVFLCGDAADRHAAMATNRVCQTIRVGDRPSFVRELQSIECALNRGAMLDLCTQPAVGARCRVAAGPLHGLEGVVIRRAKTARLVLQVSFIGQGAVVEIDADLLELVD